jgi:hypothetical protein
MQGIRHHSRIPLNEPIRRGAEQRLRRRALHLLHLAANLSRLGAGVLHTAALGLRADGGGRMGTLLRMYRGGRTPPLHQALARGGMSAR